MLRGGAVLPRGGRVGTEAAVSRPQLEAAREELAVG
jgi:hypothetical protein